MSTDPTQATAEQDKMDQLREEIALAADNAEESYRIDPNSFGAGFDEGKVTGLRWALSLMSGASA